MRPLVRAAAFLLGALLSVGATAQSRGAPSVLLTDVEVHRVSLDAEVGPYRVVGRAISAAPVVSGRVHVWATLTPVPPLVPLAEATPTPQASAADVAVKADVPAEVALRPVYPNPLTSRARIPYELPEAGPVQLALYDALGREVAVLVDGDAPAGWHEARLDALRLSPGLYHVRLTAGTFVGTVRFTVIR